MKRPYGWNESGSHRCTNSEPGTMGHECGKPAAWIGRKANGFEACFCEDCAKRGADARAMSCWSRMEQLPAPNATGATVATCPECEQMNDCQKAFELLHNMPDAQAIGGSDGPRIELRRKIAAPGTVSDGTRVFIVKPCERWRWLTVTLGWDTLGEIDQRNYFQQPDAMVQAVLDVIERRAEPYREELTAAGPQLVIPGCERQPPNGPVQLSLFA